MKIKKIFTKFDNVDIKSYLTKKGINNIEEYLAATLLEDLDNYDNIEKAAKDLLKFTKGGDINVN